MRHLQVPAARHHTDPQHSTGTPLHMGTAIHTYCSKLKSSCVSLPRPSKPVLHGTAGTPQQQHSARQKSREKNKSQCCDGQWLKEGERGKRRGREQARHGQGQGQELGQGHGYGQGQGQAAYLMDQMGGAEPLGASQ